MIEDVLPFLMFASMAVLLFSGFPVAFVLGGVALAFGLLGIAFGMFSFMEFNNIVYRIWGGVAENVLLVSVPMFVLMGVALERSGVADDLLNCLARLFRRVPGSLAVALTIMGTVLAASTGIVGASIVMLGVIGLPTMMRLRYRPELATGTICAAGTLGILIPPSIMLVLMGDLMRLSVGDLFMGAVFPGLLLASLYIVYIIVLCYFRPDFGPPIATADDANETVGELTWMFLKALGPPLFLIGLVLGSIFFGWTTPTEASGVGAFGAFVLAAANRRLSFAVVKDILDQTVITVAMVFVIFIGATAFSYVFRSLGGEEVAEHALLSLKLGPWALLFVLMGVIFLLGFFFEWLEIILIVLPLFGPIVKVMDFGSHVPSADITLWFAILVAVNLQTSFLTPPFGFALFYIKGVAPPEVTMGHIYRGIIPFVILQIIGLALVMAFPALATWLPSVSFT